MFVSDYWASMSKPLCSMSSFFLYNKSVVCTYYTRHGQLSWSDLLRAVSATCVPVILPYFDSFFEQVCPVVRPHLAMLAVEAGEEGC